jgi:hypothetical protein
MRRHGANKVDFSLERLRVEGLDGAGTLVSIRGDHYVAIVIYYFVILSLSLIISVFV